MQQRPEQDRASADTSDASASDEETTAAAGAPRVVPSESNVEAVVQLRSARQQAFDQRARRMFAKHNLAVEPNWIPLNTGADPAELVDRVHKPIRIRVHRHCHKCDTLIGPDKICPGCEHRRCKKCPRSPTERHEAPSAADDKGGKRAKGGEGKGSAEPLSKGPVLVIRNPRTGAHILVHNRATNMARRACHKCEAPFVPSTAQSCASCGHVRCTKCPRVDGSASSASATSVSEKWQTPPAVRGDGVLSSEEEDAQLLLQQPQHLRQERVFRRPRQRIRWTCDNCSTLFVEGQKACGACGHDRCDGCRRLPPTKPQDAVDVAAIRSLNDKLSAFAITAAC